MSQHTTRSAGGAHRAEQAVGPGDARLAAAEPVAVLDGDGDAREGGVVPLGHRAVADAVAVERLYRQVELAVESAHERAALATGAADAVQRLVEADNPARPDLLEEGHHRLGLGLG